jgi:hypothetical protein
MHIVRACVFIVLKYTCILNTGGGKPNIEKDDEGLDVAGTVASQINPLKTNLIVMLEYLTT